MAESEQDTKNVGFRASPALEERSSRLFQESGQERAAFLRTLLTRLVTSHDAREFRRRCTAVLDAAAEDADAARARLLGEAEAYVQAREGEAASAPPAVPPVKGRKRGLRG